VWCAGGWRWGWDGGGGVATDGGKDKRMAVAEGGLWGAVGWGGDGGGVCCTMRKRGFSQAATRLRRDFQGRSLRSRQSVRVPEARGFRVQRYRRATHGGMGTPPEGRRPASYPLRALFQPPPSEPDVTVSLSSGSPVSPTSVSDRRMSPHVLLGDIPHTSPRSYAAGQPS